MAVVVDFDSVFSHTEAPSEVSPSDTLATNSPNCASTNSRYDIKHKLQSECSLVLFAEHATTSERVVMKILLNYEDSRYSLETAEKRQQCQLEALSRNRTFTPEAYIGLAQIKELDLQQKRIQIDEILYNPKQYELKPDAEYALIMHELPEKRRLDVLLRELDEASLREHLHLLTAYIANIHSLPAPTIISENAVEWGSYEQLHNKLLDNLALLDMVSTKYESEQESFRSWLKETIDWLKEAFCGLFMQYTYRFYFDQRMQHVKLCHGDLKVAHIWLIPNNDAEMGGQSIKILDAIEFNPTFCNIDILSDFAMLVVDIQAYIDMQARKELAALADTMIADYLELTHQQDEIAQFVLGFYLVEKALVSAAVSILFDDLPELGLSLLKVAEMRLRRLVEAHQSAPVGSSLSMKPLPRIAIR